MTARAGVGTVRRKRSRRECDEERADGDVDEEDPSPPGTVGQQPAGDDTDGRSGSAHGTEDAEREVAFASFRERDREDRECGRRDERRAEPLERARGDQQFARLCEPGEKRRAGKERQSGEQHTPTAEEIAEPSAEQQEPAEQQAVGDHHPLQRALAELEVDLDRGKRHVHDRDVEHDHEPREAGDREDQTLVGGGILHEASPLPTL
jgi:hypothetical protein